MTDSEMGVLVESDVIKYIGPSSGGLLRNKLYTIKNISGIHLELHMPKGQQISVDVADHDLWELHEAKGAAKAKKRLLASLTDNFYGLLEIDWVLDDLNSTAEEMEDLMKDFPLDGKMKLLGKLSEEELGLLDFFHSLIKTPLTAERFFKMLKKGVKREKGN